MTTQNEVSIMSMALKRVGRNIAVADLTEDSAERRACTQFFSQGRQFLLRLTTPGFARVSAQLTVTDQTPRPGFDYEYEYPNTSLNFLGIINQYNPKAKRPRHLKGRNGEGRTVIWTNDAEAWAEWIEDVTNVNDWDVGFIDLMVVWLAKQICIPLTQDKTMYDALNKELELMIYTSKALDAGEDKIDEPGDPDWLEARS